MFKINYLVTQLFYIKRKYRLFDAKSKINTP